MKTPSEQIAFHKAEIARLEEEEKSKYKFNKYEEYFTINKEGVPVQDSWQSDSWDLDRFKFGNVFKTKEEAEKEAQITKVWRELRKFAKDSRDETICDGADIYGICFSSIKDRDAAIEHFGSRLNILNEM